MVAAAADKDMLNATTAAEKHRQLVECKAKKVLSRLEMFTRPDSGIVSSTPASSSNNGFGGSGGSMTTTNSGGSTSNVWEESSGYSQNTG